MEESETTRAKKKQKKKKNAHAVRFSLVQQRFTRSDFHTWFVTHVVARREVDRAACHLNSFINAS